MAGKRFTADLRKFVAKAKGNARLVVRKVVLEIGNGVIEKTPVGDPSTWSPGTVVPVGYVGGRARGSWQYAKGAPASGDPDTIDPSGAVSINRILGGVSSGDAVAETHFITSNLVYMRRLEYEGWSKQAPEGMVRLTIEEWQRFVENAVRSLP